MYCVWHVIVKAVDGKIFSTRIKDVSYMDKFNGIIPFALNFKL